MDGIQAVSREDLAARRQTPQNELLRKGATAALSDRAVEGLEKELDQASKDLTAVPKSYPSALERLKGQRDEYIPSEKGGERMTCDTDQVDGEIQDLKEQVESLEKQAGEARDPAEAERLEKELRAAEARLQAKDNDAYRRQHADYSPLG